MSAQLILDDLAARGVRIWAESNRLKLDAPVGVLTAEDKAKLAELKPALLAVLRSETKTCLDCDGALNLQDRAHDVWWCPGCRTFSDGTGRLLDRCAVTKPLTLEAVEARRLLDDLRAAGCGFVFDDGELRLTHPSRMSTALWMRFEASGQDFYRLAKKYVMELADAAITESAMIN